MSQSTAGLRQERREVKYNFDEVIDRSKNRSAKYDEREKKFGRKDVIPLWIADKIGRASCRERVFRAV